MSSTNGQSVESSLAYRHSVYDLLRRIFLWKFPLELFAELVETAKAGSSREGNGSCPDATLRGFLKTLATESLPYFHRDFHIAYTSLFVGPYHLPAPPYESVYTSPGKLLMQDEAVDVRAAYARNGFQVASVHGAPDDSIGIELEFMCALNKDCFDALREKDHAKALALLSAQQEFCDRHLLKWIPKFCCDIAANSTSQFWQIVAVFTREFVQEEPAVLSVLMNMVTALAEAKSDDRCPCEAVELKVPVHHGLSGVQ